MKRVDPFYLSPQWAALRRFVLARDCYRCVVPGCGRRAVIVDHIISRRQGGKDHPNNLRSLCKLHDNQIKERGVRGIGRGHNGQFTSICDVKGRPTDPSHPWHRSK